MHTTFERRMILVGPDPHFKFTLPFYTHVKVVSPSQPHLYLTFPTPFTSIGVYRTKKVFTAIISSIYGRALRP